MRLLVRTRANYAPPALGLLVLSLGIVDATYGVAMLRAIGRSAETTDGLIRLAAPNDSGATIVPAARH